MFQNNDLDLIAEKANPDNPNQVTWYQRSTGSSSENRGRADPASRDAEPVTAPSTTHPAGRSSTMRPGPNQWQHADCHVVGLPRDRQPDARCLLPARPSADQRWSKARAAVEKIEAPGLNVVWASASGDIRWWAAAKLPLRPAGVNPSFILDGASAEADKLRLPPPSAPTRRKRTPRAAISSRPTTSPCRPSGIEMPGYYNLADRGQRLNQRLAMPR